MENGTEFIINGVVADLANDIVCDRHGNPVSLRHQSLNVLRYLLKNPDRLVTKEELMAAVWPQTAVTDDSLVQCIHDIRRALSDEQRTIVKTVQRRGYRLDLRNSGGLPRSNLDHRPFPLVRTRKAINYGAAGVIALVMVVATPWLYREVSTAENLKAAAESAVAASNSQSEELQQSATASLKAHDFLLRALDHLNRDTEDDTGKAISLLEKALAADPAYGRAHAAMATAQISLLAPRWGSAQDTGQEQLVRNFRANVSKARQTQPQFTQTPLALWAFQTGNFREGLGIIDKTLNATPQDSHAQAVRAMLLNATGRATEAQELLDLMISQDAAFQPKTLRALSMALLSQAKYQEAAVTVERLMAQGTATRSDHFTLVSSLGHMGKFSEAAGAIERFNQLSSLRTLEPMTVQEAQWHWNGHLVGYHRPYVDILISGLRKAGVREGAEADFPFERFESRIRLTADGALTAIGTTDIGALRAGGLFDRGVQFIDVRAHDAYRLSHVPGAVSLPLATDLTQERLAKVVATDREVVFYCGSKYCGAAAIAAAKAVAWGYRKVYRMSGGLPAWKEADCPVVLASRN